jgi:hypothetical protein
MPSNARPSTKNPVQTASRSGAKENETIASAANPHHFQQRILRFAREARVAAIWDCDLPEANPAHHPAEEPIAFQHT